MVLIQDKLDGWKLPLKTELAGYLWYVKAEHENRLRWEDYLEMSMVEGVKQANDVASWMLRIGFFT